MALHAQSATFNGTVALSSQLVDRGQAITPNTPILQGAASWTFPTGWSLGVSGSTEAHSPDHVAEASVQASRYWLLSGGWQMRANLMYYRYSGSVHSRVFDRIEGGIHWTYRDVLTFGLSTIQVLGARDHRPRAAADLDLHWPLPWHFYLSAGAGIAQSLATPYSASDYASSDDDDHVSSYDYGHVGLMWSKGAWQIELDRIVTERRMRRQWGAPYASPWVATISWSF